MLQEKDITIHAGYAICSFCGTELFTSEMILERDGEYVCILCDEACDHMVTTLPDNSISSI